MSSETVGWIPTLRWSVGVRRAGVHHVEDAVDRFVALDAQDGGAEDLLGVRVDDDLHEAERLAFLDGAADARHRPLADEERSPEGARLALGRARRVRAADRCRARSRESDR